MMYTAQLQSYTFQIHSYRRATTGLFCTQILRKPPNVYAPRHAGAAGRTWQHIDVTTNENITTAMSCGVMSLQRVPALARQVHPKLVHSYKARKRLALGRVTSQHGR